MPTSNLEAGFDSENCGNVVEIVKLPVITSPPLFTRLLLAQYDVLDVLDNVVFVIDRLENIVFENPVTRVLIEFDVLLKP